MHVTYQYSTVAGSCFPDKLLQLLSLQYDSHLFKYVECFQLKRAPEPPKWDLWC